MSNGVEINNPQEAEAKKFEIQNDLGAANKDLFERSTYTKRNLENTRDKFAEIVEELGN